MEEVIIEFIKKNEFIYNKKHHNYKNIYLRDKKFLELSQKLKIPIEKVKTKWRNLRDTFQKEVKTMKSCASGSGASTPPKTWKWFDIMSFMLDIDTANEKTTGNYSRELVDVNEYSNTSESIEIQSDIETSFFDMELDYDIGNPSPSTSTALPKRRLDSNSSSSSSTTQKRASNKNKNEALLNEANDEMKQLLALAKKSFVRPEEAEKNPISLFFDSIATEVIEAQISPADFGEMRIEIIKVINKMLYEKP